MEQLTAGMMSEGILTEALSRRSLQRIVTRTLLERGRPELRDHFGRVDSDGGLSTMITRQMPHGLCRLHLTIEPPQEEWPRPE